MPDIPREPPPPPQIQWTETPDADFRRAAPATQPTPAFVPPRIEQFELANHLHVYLVERHELPIVSVQYVGRRGAEDVRPERAGLAMFSTAMLELGTTHRTSLQLADDFESIGAEHATAVDWDSNVVGIKVLASNLPAGLELLADQVENSNFPAEEVDRLRVRRGTAIRQEMDSPATMAINLAVRAIYPASHPYSRTLLGTEAANTATTRAELVAFYQHHFVPADSGLIIIGDATRATVTPQLERLFGAWHVAAPAVHTAPVPAQVRGAGRLYVIDRPGSPQSNVIVAQVGVARTSPDYIPLVVMNTILGGMFSSRINLNLREAHGWTYGASSRFLYRRNSGPFFASAPIHTAHTAEGIREMLNELSRMRTSDVSATELSDAQSRIVDSLPARFEGVESTAQAVRELFVYGLPLNEYETLGQRIRAVTVADVRRVAEHYLAPDVARVIVVGDRGAIEQGLHGLNLGTMQMRTPLGDPATGAAAHPAAAGGAHPATGGAHPAAGGAHPAAAGGARGH
jgi:zinc protease